jgi:hypothetical protein
MVENVARLATYRESRENVEFLTSGKEAMVGCRSAFGKPGSQSYLFSISFLGVDTVLAPRQDC